MDIRETNETIKIDPKKIAEFEELPDSQASKWTPEIDAILLKFWGKKQKAAMAEKLGMPVGTLDHRYKTLMKAQDER